MAEETDADLLVYMSMAETDGPAARAAWEAFYLRHVGYLYAVCFRTFGALVGPDGVADLVSETFRRAFRRAETFDPAGLENADRLRRRCRAWLGRIAQRLGQSMLRDNGRLGPVHLDPGHWQNLSRPRAAPPGDPEQIRRVRETLGRLSRREQIVLRATMQWYRPDQDHQRMPGEEVAALARTLETTPENLRQIRRRGLARLRDLLTRPAQTGETE